MTAPRPDYLWDRSGEVDPVVASLEKKLAPLRHRPRPVEKTALPRRRPTRMWILGGTLAAAAALVVAVVGSGLRKRPHLEREAASAPQAAAVPAGDPGSCLSPALASFVVRRLAGAPAVGTVRLSGDGVLAVGGWLETDEASRAEIQVADIGAVRVEPRSRVRLVGTGPAEHRLELARGRISARVNAPPRLFVVETPAATAVDLGCAYTLEVDDHGRGRLQVTSGEVLLEGHGRTSHVPAGAIAETRPGFGPGTPYVADAPAGLRAALGRLVFGPRGAGTRAAIRQVVRLARAADAVTLEQLAPRLEGEERTLVETRRCALAGCPATPAGSKER